MAADEQTTWGEVCANVGFSDNLYRTCRKKVPWFQGAGFARHDEDEGEDEDEPFSKRLAKSALPVPEVPPEGWEDVEESLLEDIFGEDATKYLLAGGIAVAAGLVWWFFLRDTPQTAVVTETPAPSAAATTQSALTAKAA
jgi:hypothetical protein